MPSCSRVKSQSYGSSWTTWDMMQNSFKSLLIKDFAELQNVIQSHALLVGWMDCCWMDGWMALLVISEKFDFFQY